MARAVMPRAAVAVETAARADPEAMAEPLPERIPQRDRFQPPQFLVVFREIPVKQDWEDNREILAKAVNRGSQRHRAA